MNIIIVMPTYNEADNIGRMIDVLMGTEFQQIAIANMYLLVVDDNSPDGTADIVHNKMKLYSNLHILTGKRHGLGNAYVRGMKYAMKDLHADAVIEMDADFQHQPFYVKRMVEEFVKGADYVIGSRYIDGGSMPSDWEWYRKQISCLGNVLVRFFLQLSNIRDLTSGFKLTRVNDLLDQIDLDDLMELGRFAYKIDLLYRTIALSKKTIEIPIHFLERNNETTKFKYKEVIATIHVVLVLRIKLFLKRNIWFYGKK